MESDGFTLVKRSRKRRLKSKNCATLQSTMQTESESECCVNLSGVIQQVSTEDSDFCEKLCKVVLDQRIQQIVCYGIGRLGSCKLAQYQFAVLVNILQRSPHLQNKRMYDNILKSNWDQLKFCSIIGNSFQSYLLHSTSTSLINQVPHLFKSSEHSVEDELPAFRSYQNVFNNTVAIRFLPSVNSESCFLETLPVDTSQDGLEIISGFKV
ncbi:hypothetical protein ACHWQZ_G003978 [Mnemiopsis leidyi]